MSEQQTKNPKHTWICSCGLVVPKKWALLSGDPTYKYGYHVHCPRCGKTIAQHVKPKETQ